jgi:hypothetical protein
MIILVPLILISFLVLSQFSVVGILVKLWVLIMSTNVASLLQFGMMVTIAVICGSSFWFAKQLKII